jgi:crotonobetainyl-CoA:carnitine CoA-transferase CaiB-like acyl-CoA transferase
MAGRRTDVLSHLRVLDLTDSGSALCGQMLGDLGAQVLLVEPAEGMPSRRLGPFADGKESADTSLPFWSVHRGKRSCAVDFADEGDRSHFLSLVDAADVVIDSGRLREAGISYALLAERRPGLVFTAITPFGCEGPKAGWAATDLIVTAASGALNLTGDHDRPPLSATVPQGFLNAGAEAAVATMIALEERKRSGLGQHVDVSAQTAMMMTTQSTVLSHGWNAVPIERFGGGLRLGPFHLRFVYPCKDGFVNFTFLFGDAIGPPTARFFRWLHEEGAVNADVRDLDWVSYPGLVATGAVSPEKHVEIMQTIESFTLRHTKAELFEAAFERKVLIVPLSDARDLAESPQLAAREFWTDVAHAERSEPVRYAGPFVKMDRTPIRYASGPPTLGARADWEGGAAALAPGQGPTGGLPLEGLKVLDFSWVYAAPAVTRYLADYGATVVRVESSTAVDALRNGEPFKDATPGYERSGNYANVNMGKLNLGLNLKVPEARDVARKLAAWADVVVENYTPRMMKQWELDYEHLREVNPALVMLSSCLTGQTGPHKDLTGYGTMGAAISGFGFLTGWPDRNPAAPFVAYTDYVSPRFATTALLAALDHRERTGEGQYLDCSQGESTMHLIGEPLLEYQVNGTIRRAAGNANPHWAPSGVYPVAGEDRWIAIAAPDEASWQALAAHAGQEWSDDARFATQGARLEHRAALDDQMAAWTVRQDVGALEAALQAAGVPAHRVTSTADCFDDAQLAARGHFVWREHPEVGSVPYEGSRFLLSRTPATLPNGAPTLGQHNQQILGEFLGLDDEAITELVIAGAIE